MKKFKLRAVAWVMAFLLLLSSSGAGTVLAAEEGNVLTITADMVDEKGNLLIDGGEWDKIVLSREAAAKKVVLFGVTAKELVVESGTDCEVQLQSGSIATVNVTAPQIKVLDYSDIVKLLAGGKSAGEVAELYRNSLAEKKRLDALKPTLVTTGNVKVDTVQVSGSAVLKLKEEMVGEVSIQGNGSQDSMEVEIKGYDGAVSVAQTNGAGNATQMLRLTLTESNLEELNVSGTTKSACYIEGTTTANIQEMNITGAANVTVNAKADSVKVDEQAKNSSLKIYSEVKNVVVEADNSKVSFALSAKVDNAVVEGDGVKVSNSGTLKDSTISGEGSDIKRVPVSTSPNKTNSSSKPKPTATPKPTETPVPEPTATPEPEATPKPTATPKPEETPTPEPTVTPGPYPTVKPDGGTTDTSTDGALDVPTPEPEETPTPTPEPDEGEGGNGDAGDNDNTGDNDSGDDTETEIPDGEYAPESWFSWEEYKDGVVITELELPYDEETDELAFDGTLMIPKTLGGLPVVRVEEAFYYPEITEIILPEGLLEIGDYAFEGSSIATITIPASVTKIDELAFDYFEGTLEEILVASGNKNFSSLDGCLYNKDASELIKVPVAKNISTFEIPESVTKVAEYAFDYSKVETIILTKNVKEFDLYCFTGCDYLTEVEVVDENPYFEDYGEYVLTENGKELIFVESSVTDFVIPKTLTTLNTAVFSFSGCLPLDSVQVEAGNQTFCVSDGILYSKDRKKLVLYTEEYEGTEFEVPGTVTEIGARAFYGSPLEKITIPDTVTTIKVNAFYYNRELKELHLPANLVEIPANMCAGCESLAAIEIPDGVEEIGSGAFRGCENLVSVHLPDSVSNVGGSAFARCTSLSDVKLSAGMTAIRSLIFAECESLVSVNIPSGIEVIYGTAFSHCDNLSRIYIPYSVTRIVGRLASFDSELTIITTNEYVIEYAERYGYDVRSN